MFPSGSLNFNYYKNESSWYVYVMLRYIMLCYLMSRFWAIWCRLEVPYYRYETKLSSPNNFQCRGRLISNSVFHRNPLSDFEDNIRTDVMRSLQVLCGNKAWINIRYCTHFLNSFLVLLDMSKYHLILSDWKKGLTLCVFKPWLTHRYGNYTVYIGRDL